MLVLSTLNMSTLSIPSVIRQLGAFVQRFFDRVEDRIVLIFIESFLVNIHEPLLLFLERKLSKN